VDLTWQHLGAVDLGAEVGAMDLSADLGAMDLGADLKFIVPTRETTNSVGLRDGNRAGRTRIYGSRIHTHEIKPNPYPFTLVGMDLYPYPYPLGIRYPMDIHYLPAH
jgi:hypothetical protein